jgi:hypothetical protein
MGVPTAIHGNVDLVRCAAAPALHGGPAFRAALAPSGWWHFPLLFAGAFVFRIKCRLPGRLLPYLMHLQQL